MITVRFQQQTFMCKKQTPRPVHYKNHLKNICGLARN